MLAPLLLSAIALQATDETRAGLYAAAESGDVIETRRLIGEGAAVDAVDDSGRTALMFAALKGNVDVIDVLLDAGATVNRAAPNGTTALHAAAYGRLLDSALFRSPYGHHYG